MNQQQINELRDEIERRRINELELQRQRIMDLNEAERKRNSDLNEAERKRNFDLNEAERKRNSDLNEAERKRNSDLNEAERKRNSDLNEAERKISLLKEELRELKEKNGGLEKATRTLNYNSRNFSQTNKISLNNKKKILTSTSNSTATSLITNQINNYKSTLKDKINKDGTNQWIDPDGILIHEYYCKGKNGKYVKGNGTIAVGLKLDNKGNKYVLSILSNGNHPDKFVAKVQEICDESKLFKMDAKFTFVADVGTDDSRIVDFFNLLLSKIKDYRETDIRE